MLWIMVVRLKFHPVRVCSVSFERTFYLFWGADIFPTNTTLFRIHTIRNAYIILYNTRLNFPPKNNKRGNVTISEAAAFERYCSRPYYNFNVYNVFAKEVGLMRPEPNNEKISWKIITARFENIDTEIWGKPRQHVRRS